MPGPGKPLIVLGALILVAGVLFSLIGKAPWIGKLPGDIVIERGNFRFVFPLATSLLVSALLTILFKLFRR